MGIKGFFSKEQNLDRLRRDYIPALKEKFEAKREPSVVEQVLSVSEAEGFTESLISSEDQRLIDSLILQLADGGYHARELAGKPEDGNRHVHDFIIEKSRESTRLFYVDPEHSMGKSRNSNILNIPRLGDLRPRVNVLYTVRILPGNSVPEIELLRYRAAAIPKESIDLNKPQMQFEMAKLILETGALPSLLREQEKEITFRLSFRRDEERYKVLFQAREASSAEHIKNVIECLIRKEEVPSHDPVEGQLRRFRAIMRTHFPRLLRENKFISRN